MKKTSNKNNTIEVTWNADKSELLASKFTGVVKIRDTVRNYDRSKKSRYSNIIVRTEYYKDGLLHREDGPAIVHNKTLIEQSQARFDEYYKDPMRFYPDLPPIVLENEYYKNGVNQKNSVCHRCSMYTNKFTNSPAICDICLDEMYAKGR